MTYRWTWAYQRREGTLQILTSPTTIWTTNGPPPVNEPATELTIVSWVTESERPARLRPRRGVVPEAEWEHAGLTCYILKHPELGNLNGYVIVPRGHPDFQKSYDAVDADVHGGLTYADFEREGTPSHGWTLGFGTAHFMDRVPGLDRLRQGRDPGYPQRSWTLANVRAETNRLAEQLAARGNRMPRGRVSRSKRARKTRGWVFPSPRPVDWVEL